MRQRGASKGRWRAIYANAICRDGDQDGQRSSTPRSPWLHDHRFGLVTDTESYDATPASRTPRWIGFKELLAAHRLSDGTDLVPVDYDWRELADVQSRIDDELLDLFCAGRSHRVSARPRMPCTFTWARQALVPITYDFNGLQNRRRSASCCDRPAARPWPPDCGHTTREWKAVRVPDMRTRVLPPAPASA
jgi:hypothetical protein